MYFLAVLGIAVFICSLFRHLCVSFDFCVFYWYGLFSGASVFRHLCVSRVFFVSLCICYLVIYVFRQFFSSFVRYFWLSDLWISFVRTCRSCVCYRLFCFRMGSLVRYVVSSVRV